MSNSNLKSDPKSVKLEDIGSSLLNPATEETLQSIAGLSIPKHDTRELVYTSGVLTSVVYKLSGVTVATKTLGYTSGDLTSVTIL
jgi:hypothetical protein